MLNKRQTGRSTSTALIGALLCFGASACGDAPVEEDISAATVSSELTLPSGIELDDGALPTALTINLVTSEQPSHNSFTRYLTFKNRFEDVESFALAFSRTSPLHYTGTLDPDDLDDFEALIDRGGRTYWDKMYFENHGGSTELDIASMEVWIEYGEHGDGPGDPWRTDMQIASATNKTLASGNSSFYLSRYTGRRLFALDHLGWTSTEFYAAPTAFRYMVYDLGKSGSDTDYPSVNPKYASSGVNLCSETVSWYYHEYNVNLTDSETGDPISLRDIEANQELHDAFKNAGRLYCYHLGRADWMLVNRDGSWHKTSSDEYVPYSNPQPGDYLDRRNGHAMMIAEWTPRVGTSGGTATVIDGPYPVAFRNVPVHDIEDDGETDFCVGRIPFND